MSSINYLNEDSSLANNVRGQRAAYSQNPQVSRNELIHPRIDDFIKEPLDSGNRNVMLPDRNSNVDSAIKASQERMEKDIEDKAKALGKPETINTSEPAEEGKGSDK
ncbi:hypothetical protein F4814DRAFT_451981 [Daldinia grandis]|nr:hypothetical protein F4814DRAFT_451981 [Daldinia grandis]